MESRREPVGADGTPTVGNKPTGRNPSGPGPVVSAPSGKKPGLVNTGAV